jgi:4-amino-4-deoxy-L-arabinose transferase-like glycosyltransferase
VTPTLFKRLYILTIVEAGLLAVGLYSIPGEASSKLILGRSVLRWILILPAFFLALVGFIHLMSLIRNNQTDLIIERWRSLVSASKTDLADRLVIFNLLAPVALFASVFFLQHYGIPILVRLSPWLLFVTIVLIQADYFLYKLITYAGGEINLKRSLSNGLNKLNQPFFERQGMYVEEETKSIRWIQSISLIVLAATFIFVEYYTVTFAQLNSDEGWYLYAARQVYHGQKLYQDFAFTQLPLVPYIYGLGLLFWKSIYMGRLISVLIFAISLILLYQLSRKYFTIESFLWILILFAVYPFGLYFDTIVKTYALTLLCFVLSLYIWLSGLKAKLKYPLLFVVLLLGVLTRITVAFYVVVIGLAALFQIWRLENRWKIYLLVFASCLPLVLWGALFLYPDPSLMLWNIYGYNATIHNMKFSVSALRVFLPNLQTFLRYAGPFRYLGIPLGLGFIHLAFARDLLSKQTKGLLWSALAGIAFIFLHFFGGKPLTEYYVPPIMLLVAISVWFLFSFRIKSGLGTLIHWGSRLTLSLIAILWIVSGKFGVANYDLYQGHPPIQTIQTLAGVVNGYYPGEPVFALEGLYVAIEADRAIFPGLSMAQFSILDMDTPTVSRIHMVNAEMVADRLRAPDTKIVILTDREISSLEQSITDFDKLLADKYTNVFQIDHFGQKSGMAYVFIRK